MTNHVDPRRAARGGWRKVALAIVGLGGAVAFACILHAHLPLQTWLFWRYAVCWALVVVFAAACVSVGYELVKWLVPDGLSLDERLVLSFSAGVFCFFSCVFLAGVAGMLGTVTFVAIPALFLVSCGRRAWRSLAPEVLRALRGFQERPRPLRLTALTTVGFLGVVMVYLPILAPDNVSFDARWYHLANAEHYAAAGAIRRFPEGLLAGTYPQAATLLYTWAFLEPLGSLFDRVELAAHLELCWFLATLAAIPCIIRRLLPTIETRATWTAFFLFPAIFVYDSGLVCGADHLAALWAGPIWIALCRAWERLAVRDCLLLGMFVSAAVLTKYTAFGLAVGPLFAVLARAVWLSIRAAKQRGAIFGAWRGPAAFFVACAALTSQHWLRNWVFYHDPVYPVAADLFGATPWTASSSGWLQTFRATRFIPGVAPVENLRDVLYTLATFAVVPHDWPDFHGKIPVFGSLFSLATLALPIIGQVRRAAALAIAIYFGLVFWALFDPQDRYLQAFVPWMAAVSVAVGAVAWRAGGLARAAVAALVALQVVWAGDLYFWPSHAMTKQPPISAAVEQLGSARYRDSSDRTRPFAFWAEVGKALPNGARVLVHEGDVHLGLGSMAVLDLVPYSYGVDYGRTGSLRGVYDLLRSLGVTHLIWHRRSREADSLASDLAFHAFATRAAIPVRVQGSFTVARMPDTPPESREFGEVAVVTCGRAVWRSGFYRVKDLAPPLPLVEDSSRYRPVAEWASLSQEARDHRVGDAEFLVLKSGCGEASADSVREFEPIAQRGDLVLLTKRPRP